MVKLDLKRSYSTVSSASTFLLLYILFAMSLSGRNANFSVFQQNCLRFVDELNLKSYIMKRQSVDGLYINGNIPSTRLVLQLSPDLFCFLQQTT